MPICRRSLSVIACACLLLLLGSPSGAEAQKTGDRQPAASADPPEAVTSDPSLRLSPAEALRRFEPGKDEEYTLGAGDEISIQFPGRPEMAAKSIIGPDGRITIPLAGPLMISDLTREAAAKKIAAALAAYYTSLTATVEVLSYGSNHVTLLGDVKQPGMISFDQTPTLLEVLSRGGIQARPDGNLPEQCVIYRGDQVLWVDLQDLLASGSPLADLRLRRNDLIFVPDRSSRSVTVMGQVQHPGLLVLKHDSTVTTLLAEAGGINDAAGGNPEIEIVHRTSGSKTQYLHFKELLKPAIDREVSLSSGDVIYVPKSGIAKVGYVMQQLAPFLTVGTFVPLALH